MVSLADELERLQSLHERGVLSAEEFARAKGRLFSESARTDSAHGLNRLRRSRTDRVFGGVCGGLGHPTGMPSWGWRLMFCLSVVCFGFGVLLYVLLWLLMPLDD